MKGITVLSAVLLTTVALAAIAAIPQTISFQGLLKTSDGFLVPDGEYEITFKAYDQAEGGSPLWTEVHSAVSVHDGVYNVILGSQVALDLDFNHQYWLGVTIGQEVELAPRVEFTSSPYALGAMNAQQLAGKSSAEYGQRVLFAAGYDLPDTAVVEIPHHRVFTVVVGERHASPDTDAIGFIHCIENDNVVTWIGFDGDGNMVRGRSPLYTAATLLTVNGGEISLDTYGTDPRRLILRSHQGRSVGGVLTW